MRSRASLRAARDGGFSFIELLAYMAVAALLILAAIPQFNAYRGHARDLATREDVRNVAIAVEAWAIDHPGQLFPSAYAGWNRPAFDDSQVRSTYGVRLSDGTHMWVLDRTARTEPWTPVPKNSAPGAAFCIYAYNPAGAKFNDGDHSHVAYNSTERGMGTECDAI